MALIKCGSKIDGIIEKIVVTPHRFFIIMTDKVLKVKNKEGHFYCFHNCDNFIKTKIIEWNCVEYFSSGPKKEYSFKTIDLDEKDEKRAIDYIEIVQNKPFIDDEIMIYNRTEFDKMSEKKTIYGRVTGYYYDKFHLVIQTKRAEIKIRGYFRGRGCRDYSFTPEFENIGNLIGKNIMQFDYENNDFIITDNDGELYTTKNIRCEPDYFKDINYNIYFI